MKRPLSVFLLSQVLAGSLQAGLSSSPIPETQWGRGAQVFDGARSLLPSAPVPATEPQPAGDGAQALPLSPEEAQLLDTVLKSADIVREHDVWPGFELLSQPILLYRRDETALLINHPAPPEGFLPYRDPRLPAGVQVHVRRGSMQGVPVLSFDHPLNGHSTFVYSLQGDGDKRLGVATVVIAHERFHSEQKRKKWKSPPYPQDPYPLEEPENIALAALEQKLLVEALAASDPLARQEAIREFLSVRQHRYDKLGPEGAKLEAWLEHTEGTALYADDFVRISLKDKAPELREELEKMSSVIDRLKMELAVSSMERFRYYGTGAAQATLLDLLGVPSWKQRVEQGETLNSILGQAVPLNPTEIPHRVAQAGARHDYASLLSRAQRVVQEYQEEKREAVDAFQKGAAAGFPISLTLKARGYSAANSGKTYNLDPDRTLYTKGDVFFTVGDSSLKVDGRGLIQGWDGGKMVFETYLQSAPVATVDGKPLVLLDGEFPFSQQLDIHEPGLELVSLQEGVIVVRGRGLEVKVGSASSFEPASTPATPIPQPSKLQPCQLEDR